MLTVPVSFNGHVAGAAFGCSHLIVKLSMRWVCVCGRLNLCSIFFCIVFHALHLFVVATHFDLS